MHLGNVYAALMSWLSAKSQQGEWVLRIEDIDPQRSKPQYADQLRDDLEWLGLSWDCHYVQSERYDRYEEVLARLEAQGLLVASYKNRKERMAVGAPQTGDVQGFLSERKPATAVLLPDGEPLVVRRSDGAWAYQLAVVVDDAEMGITEVVRGRDLADSVRFHRFLQDRLGYPSPDYKHLPLLINEQGQRLCKRDRSLDMGVLREQYSPEQIVGRLAFVSGLIEQEEPLRADELLPLFDWGKIPTDDILVH